MILAAIDGHAKLLRAAFQSCMDRLEAVVAIDLGLARAEQVKIWA